MDRHTKKVMALAEELGCRYRMASEQELSDYLERAGLGEGCTVGGWYDTKKKEIVYTSDGLDWNIDEVIVHETIHYLQYNHFDDEIFEIMGGFLIPDIVKENYPQEYWEIEGMAFTFQDQPYTVIEYMEYVQDNM